ncbi:MAG: hypothetical protein R3C20_14250 [Planctomycetaceae bacterium]
MKRILYTSAFAGLLSVATVVLAQPPEGGRPDGPPPGERGPRERNPPPPNPFMEALDTNGDHVISAEELENAKASLLTLDKNGDGKLSDEETRPPAPEGRGPRDGGPRDGGPRDGGPRDGGPRDGGPRDGGPRDGGPPSPERLVAEAMRFDADGDGKLGRDELLEFARDFITRRPPQGAGRPPGPDDAPGGRDGRGRPPRDGRPSGENRPPSE